MKVVKNIDAHEKSMKAVFDAVNKHIAKYPEDFMTLYIGKRMKDGESEYIQSNTFMKEEDNDHFMKSHIWQFSKLMEVMSPSQVKIIYNHALEVYKLNMEI